MEIADVNKERMEIEHYEDLGSIPYSWQSR